jgi:hypothetical protein
MRGLADEISLLNDHATENIPYSLICDIRGIPMGRPCIFAHASSFPHHDISSRDTSNVTTTVGPNVRM